MSDQQENNEASKQNEDDCRDPDEDFDMECSDEEFRSKDTIVDWARVADWGPSPDELIELFEKVEKVRALEIEWTTPGRRPPTPATKFDSQNEEDNVKEIVPDEKSDFDFQDEVSNLRISAKAIRPAGTEVGPRGSAKKKTVSLDAILSNMARHRKLDMMEDDDEDSLP